MILDQLAFAVDKTLTIVGHAPLGGQALMKLLRQDQDFLILITDLRASEDRPVELYDEICNYVEWRATFESKLRAEVTLSAALFLLAHADLDLAVGAAEHLVSQGIPIGPYLGDTLRVIIRTPNAKTRNIEHGSFSWLPGPLWPSPKPSDKTTDFVIDESPRVKH